jgi:two-component system, response regulator RegA
MSGTRPERLALVIDDDDVFRKRLCRALEARGWRVDDASNGEAGIQLAKSQTPDLAIVDLRLSDVSGLDVVRGLHGDDSRTQIIVLTGYGSIATAIAATKLGADHFLSKPADADQILDVYQRTQTDDACLLGRTDLSLVPSLARVEWEHIQRVLMDCDGNVSRAARRLGLHRRSLQRKLSKNPPHD